MGGAAAAAAASQPSTSQPSSAGNQARWQLDDCLYTGLAGALALVAQRLQARGHDVRISEDAGKFVCNYTYFKCLHLCEALQQAGRPSYGLFVHVPTFAVVDEPRQRLFAEALVAELQLLLRRAAPYEQAALGAGEGEARRVLAGTPALVAAGPDL